MIHDLGNKREMVHEIFEMKPFKVICEPLVLTLAYVGMIGPLATPYTLHPGPKGDEVRHINIRLHFFFPPALYLFHSHFLRPPSPLQCFWSSLWPSSTWLHCFTTSNSSDMSTKRFLQYKRNYHLGNTECNFVINPILILIILVSFLFMFHEKNWQYFILDIQGTDKIHHRGLWRRGSPIM